MVCAIDVLESVSVASALAFKAGYRLNNTQELVALGLANMLGAAFNCYTTTGAFARSAVNADVGATSQVSGMVGGLAVMLVLLFATPLFRNMPSNAQGAIIINAVVGLAQVGTGFRLWRTNKLDWLVYVAAVVGVLAGGVEIGLLVSIALSLSLALAKVAFPHTASLGEVADGGGGAGDGSRVFRDLDACPSASRVPGVIILRVDAPLFFANAARVGAALDAAEAEAVAMTGPVHGVVLDLGAVSDFDATAARWFDAYVASARRRGVTVALARPSKRVAALLAAAGMDKVVGRENVFGRVGNAVDALRAAAAAAPPKPVDV